LADCQLGGVSCLSAAWYVGVVAQKTRLESGPVTVDLTTSVVNRFYIADKQH